ncbi:unnamed protein product, partial [Mesorhabditis spiculigera]
MSILRSAICALIFIDGSLGRGPLKARRVPEQLNSALCSTTPPGLWCENDALAKECGWDLACSEYKKGVYNKPVQITLLYESLCPGCQRFIQQQLYPAFKAFPSTHLKIELVPYGNAKIQGDEIVCQHGAEECQINKFESCVIDSMETQDVFMPYIFCLEQQLSNKIPFDKAQSKCFRTLNVTDDVQRMTQSCLVSKLSRELQMNAAKRTNDVQPEKHHFVPWILFNNVSLESAQFLQADLTSVICQWYKGDKPAPACQAEQKRLARKLEKSWKFD